jgi:intracellular sulfur oxidation DsrE/DsrF family protein
MDRRSIWPVGSHGRSIARGHSAAEAAGEKTHRLAIHVDQSDIAQMNLALGNASNVLEHYKVRGEKVEIEIVTYSQGLHMLREDTSPVKERIKALREKMPSIVLSVCENTQRRMEKEEGRKLSFVSGATLVPSPGVVRLMELQEQAGLSPAVAVEVSGRPEQESCVREHLLVTLPSRTAEMPLRPWDAITIRSQPLSLAAEMIAS